MQLQSSSNHDSSVSCQRETPHVSAAHRVGGAAAASGVQNLIGARFFGLVHFGARSAGHVAGVRDRNSEERDDAVEEPSLDADWELACSCAGAEGEEVTEDPAKRER